MLTHWHGIRPNEFAIAIPVGLISLWLMAKLLRALASYAFPNVIPGEANTALVATIRPNTSRPATAKDLDSASTYDYIIVGTGTAGSVIAARLTEDPSVRVLAIESGHSDLKQIFSRIPAGFGRLFRSVADWDINTEKEPGCNDRSLSWPRGKMLGGCSSINAMIYNKGSPSDYDEWERLGNKGWSFDDVTPYFKKAEGLSQNAASKLTAEELRQHGRNGPWKIGYAHTTPLTNIFVDACASLGFTKIRDFNSSKGIKGAGVFQTFIDEKGQRSSASTAYLTATTAARSNLKIAVGQTVTRIIFDESGPEPRAVGVEMASGAHTPARYLARASREVIVCAGAVHTPHVLKLSGIGPLAELNRLRIPVVKELSGVGENLSDHLFATLVAVVKKGSSLQFLADPVKSIPALIQWLRTGKGPMSTNVAESAGFCRTVDREDCPESLKTNDLSTGPDSADLEILCGPVAYMEHGRQVPKENGCYCSVGPIMLRPQARGTVTLASSSPFHAPKVRANYLDNQHDIDMLVYGCKLTRQIYRSAPFKPYFKAWYKPTTNVDGMSDEQLAQYVRETSETVYHPMGTAKMGPLEDQSAVVDAELRVHGVRGLRIADAAVFPTPLPCHPCAPVVMVGEKAADLIKKSKEYEI